MSFKFFIVLSLCIASLHGAPENVRSKRSCHWKEEGPICYEPNYFQSGQWKKPLIVVDGGPNCVCQGSGVPIHFTPNNFGGGFGPGCGWCGSPNIGFPGTAQVVVVDKNSPSVSLRRPEPPVIVVEQETPEPIVICDDQPLRVKHISDPYIIENFNTQYIIDHYQGAQIEHFSRLPTIVDHYLPAAVTDFNQAGPIVYQLDCNGNVVGQGGALGAGNLGRGNSIISTAGDSQIVVVSSTQESGGSNLGFKDVHEVETVKTVNVYEVEEVPVVVKKEEIVVVETEEIKK